MVVKIKLVIAATTTAMIIESKNMAHAHVTVVEQVLEDNPISVGYT